MRLVLESGAPKEAKVDRVASDSSTTDPLEVGLWTRSYGDAVLCPQAVPKRPVRP